MRGGVSWGSGRFRGGEVPAGVGRADWRLGIKGSDCWMGSDLLCTARRWEGQKAQALAVDGNRPVPGNRGALDSLIMKQGLDQFSRDEGRQSHKAGHPLRSQFLWLKEIWSRKSKQRSGAQTFFFVGTRD